MKRSSFLHSVGAVGALGVVVDGPALANAARNATAPGNVDYMFRYYMRSETIHQQTRDLITYCKRHRIRDVILFSGNHWNMGWNLPTIPEARARVAVLRPAFNALREAGLMPSLNVWTTVGHGDFGRDERSRFKWQFMVGDDGAQCKAIPCPIDPTYVDHITQVYELFASLEPDYIYIDDDFRLYFNHEPASWSCYCPLHLNAFAQRTGRNWTRESLLAALLGSPTSEKLAVRKDWLALLGDSEVHLARNLTTAVHRTSPKTHMGLMCSGPNSHAAVGRRWLDLFDAFSATGERPALRPTYADYNDGDPRDAAAYICNMRKLQPLLGNKMRITPELESDPDTAFGKSNAYTRLQMALSFFVAGPALTLDVKPFSDTNILGYATEVDRVFDESYEYFSALAQLSLSTPHERGLQLLWDDRFPLHRNTEGSSYGAIVQPKAWEGALDLLGMATTFFSQPGVKLASRSYLEERTDDELDALMRTALAIDADAVAHIVNRGLGSMIGVDGVEPIAGCNSEHLVDSRFAGPYHGSDLVTIFMEKSKLRLREGALEISRLYGPERSFSVPGMTLFGNSVGGRIAIIPFSASGGDLRDTQFRDWKRQHVLRKMFEWAGRSPLPLFVENAANTLPIRRDGDGEIAVAIANLSFDPISNATFRIAQPFPKERNVRIESISPGSKTVLPHARGSHEGGYLRIETGIEIAPLSMTAFRIST